MPNLKAEIAYIDLGVAIGALLDMASYYADLDECKEETIKMCARELQKLPTIDPASLRPKGEWKLNEDNKWACTYCGGLAVEHPEEPDKWQALTVYCPNCGADMRGTDNG